MVFSMFNLVPVSVGGSMTRGGCLIDFDYSIGKTQGREISKEKRAVSIYLDKSSSIHSLTLSHRGLLCRP